MTRPRRLEVEWEDSRLLGGSWEPVRDFLHRVVSKGPTAVLRQAVSCSITGTQRHPMDVWRHAIEYILGVTASAFQSRGLNERTA